MESRMIGKDHMTSGFKRVPAVEKCFEILELFALLKKPLSVSEISKALHLNKSTVYNIVYTLDDLGVLEKVADVKFQFGSRLYILGRAAGQASELVGTIHPYLEEINHKTKLSAFIGIRSGMQAVIIDKVDSTFDIKIHSEIGMRIPLLAGAGGRALLAQLSDAEVEDILKKNDLKKFTPNSCMSKDTYKRLVKEVRREGIAVDMEEYIEGIRAFAIPINNSRANLQVALWVVGLKGQITSDTIPALSDYLKATAKNIESRLISGGNH